MTAPAKRAPDVSRAFWDAAAAAERFFTGLDEVHQALRRLASTLEAHGIPYAIVGAMPVSLAACGDGGALYDSRSP